MIIDIPDNWSPTAANINALPEPLRRYICHIETICDPTGDMQTIWCLRDQVRDLTAAYLAVSGKGEPLLKRLVRALRMLFNQPADHHMPAVDYALNRRLEP